MSNVTSRLDRLERALIAGQESCPECRPSQADPATTRCLLSWDDDGIKPPSLCPLCGEPRPLIVLAWPTDPEDQ